MPSTQERKVKPLEGVVYLRRSGNVHGAMELASWIFLRRKKFCSKAWFKEEHKTANFPGAQGTFYLTSSSSLRRDITWSLQGAPDPQLLSLGLWLVSDVQSIQSCYRVDKLLAPYTPLHNASLPILMRKNYLRPIGEF